MTSVKMIVESLLDEPDLSYWADQLSIEARLSRLYGQPGVPYLKRDASEATLWEGLFVLETATVLSACILFYKVQNAPALTMRYRIQPENWSNAEVLHGQENILKMVGLLERAVEHLKAHPALKVTEIVRHMEKPLNFAYNMDRYGTDS